MNMRYSAIAGFLSLTGSLLFAEAPAGYYSRLDGKQGDELRAVVKEVSIPADFESIEFGDGGSSSFKTWQCFISSDIREIDGRTMWWDMYSNNIVYTYGADNSLNTKSLNIEHAVPNSWWGGRNGNLKAYQDIFNLNPSNSEANNKKSANPIGVTVENPAFSNGLVKIGKPAVGYGGNASTVFEPSDEYKGDFARTFFYMFAAYPDIDWKMDKGGENMYQVVDGRVELLPWAKNMLLKWNAEDPVDAKEMKRNDEIFKCQKNRNPFIDMPGLADYIWGAKTDEKFISSSQAVQLVERPSAPRPSGLWMKGVNTYSSRYWDIADAGFETYGNDLWISLDGGNYQQYGNGVKIPAADKHGDIHTVKAYCEKVDGSYVLRSPVVSVTFIAKDAKVNDYSVADYEAVKSGDVVDKDGRYIITDALNSHVMGMNSSTFMTDCWFARQGGDLFVELPQDAAVVDFEPAADGRFVLRISDVNNVFKGYWTTTGNNKMKLDKQQGTPATVTIQPDDCASIAFTNYGTLQYNQQSPRFLNYTSAQGKVRLYRFVRFGNASSSITDVRNDEGNEVYVKNGEIHAPEGSAVYSIQGVRTVAGRLAKGVYIVVTRSGKTTKVVL